MNFFRPCRSNTVAISETKFGFEHIFDTGIFKGIKFCLRSKSFKVLGLYICLVCLIVCFSIFEMILFVFWLALLNSPAGQGNSEFFFHFFELYFRTCPAMFFFYFVELFFALPFCRFFQILCEIFLTSLG